MANKQLSPNISASAFNCPHCGAYAFQRWHNLAVLDTTQGQGKPPVVPKPRTEEAKPVVEKTAALDKFTRVYQTRIAQGRPFLVPHQVQVHQKLENVFASVCYNCQEVALWVHEGMQWPKIGEASAPNDDLPDEVRKDYEEASTILDLSPRGAAALLRLAIQKMCVHLGGKGENINDDIAALVKKGLDELVQQALDAVRVIGNNAVHPGQIDFNDNREMAASLFGLVNLIAEIMISRPKHVKAVYAALPAGARAAINKRDGKP